MRDKDGRWHAKSGPNDHRKDAPRLKLTTFFVNKTLFSLTWRIWDWWKFHYCLGLCEYFLSRWEFLNKGQFWLNKYRTFYQFWPWISSKSSKGSSRQDNSILLYAAFRQRFSIQKIRLFELLFYLASPNVHSQLDCHLNRWPNSNK